MNPARVDERTALKLKDEGQTRSFSSPVPFSIFFVCAAVLKPLVEVLSDPDSINRMLLSQLEQREQQAEQQKKAYTYAASYEDFVKLISTSADVNFLKQLRRAAHTHFDFFSPGVSRTDVDLFKRSILCTCGHIYTNSLTRRC